MKCSELMEYLEQLAPLVGACEWDNPGLLAGRSDKTVKSVMIALDATDQVVQQAVELKADLLLTHHPLIFKPLKKVNDQDFISRRILTLIRNDISYYAMHTNFDAAPGGMADLAAEMLGLTGTIPLEIVAEQDGTVFGIGRTGELPKQVSLKELAQLVKKRFGLPYVTIFGPDQNKLIHRAAISPGAGSSMVQPALHAGAQVLITGDIGHHTGIDCVAQNMAVIDAGHYGLEHIFIDFMAQYIKNEIDQDLIVYKEQIVFPASVIVSD